MGNEVNEVREKLAKAVAYEYLALKTKDSEYAKKSKEILEDVAKFVNKIFCYGSPCQIDLISAVYNLYENKEKWNEAKNVLLVSILCAFEPNFNEFDKDTLKEYIRYCNIKKSSYLKEILFGKSDGFPGFSVEENLFIAFTEVFSYVKSKIEIFKLDLGRIGKSYQKHSMVISKIIDFMKPFLLYLYDKYKFDIKDFCIDIIIRAEIIMEKELYEQKVKIKNY